jgi:hypothetical protein
MLQDDWNNAVSAFNDAGYKLNTIAEIWPMLTAAQKTTIKNSVLGILDTTKTNIDGLKTQVNAL